MLPPYTISYTIRWERSLLLWICRSQISKGSLCNLYRFAHSARDAVSQVHPCVLALSVDIEVCDVLVLLVADVTVSIGELVLEVVVRIADDLVAREVILDVVCASVALCCFGA